MPTSAPRILFGVGDLLQQYFQHLRDYTVQVFRHPAPMGTDPHARTAALKSDREAHYYIALSRSRQDGICTPHEYLVWDSVE